VVRHGGRHFRASRRFSDRPRAAAPGVIADLAWVLIPADHCVGVGLGQRRGGAAHETPSFRTSVLALGRPLDKKRGSPTYVNVINIYNPDLQSGQMEQS
jgi:hypothetical protein